MAARDIFPGHENAVAAIQNHGNGPADPYVTYDYDGFVIAVVAETNPPSFVDFIG